jgi:hypothetical protein
MLGIFLSNPEGYFRGALISIAIALKNKIISKAIRYHCHS